MPGKIGTGYVSVDADLAPFWAQIDKELTGLDARFKKVGRSSGQSFGDGFSGSLNDISGLRAAVNGLDRDSKKAKKGFEGLAAAVGGGSGGNIRKIARNLDDFGGATDGATATIGGFRIAIAALIPAMIGFGGATVGVVSALGPLVGLAAAAGNALGAAAQGVGVFKLATAGVADALKEQTTAHVTAGASAASNAGQQRAAARAIESAQDGVRSALNGVRDATRSLSDAETQHRAAVATLSPAIAAAQAHLMDLRDASKDAGLALIDASFAAQDATDALAALLAGPSPRILADAHRTLTDALRGEDAAAQSLADAQRALNDLLAPPDVLSVADATDAVSDALRGEERARLNLNKQLTASNAILADPAATDDQKAQARLDLADAENAVGDAARQTQHTKEALAKLEGGPDQIAVAAARRNVSDAEYAVGQAAQVTVDARDALAKVETPATANELARARLAVAEAEQTVVEATRAQNTAARELTTAEAQGIQGSQEVVTARQAIADASDAVTEAERHLADAHRDVRRANEGLSDAQLSATEGLAKAAGAATNLNEKLNSLPPAARAFVRQLIAMKPKLDDLRQTAAAGFFPGATEGLRAAAGSFEPVKKVVGETAVVLGDLSTRAGELVGSSAFGKDIETIGHNNARVLDTLGTAVLHVVSALRNLIITAGPLTQWLADMAEKWALNAAEAAKAGRESGKLADFFERTRAVTERLTSILGHLASGLLGVGHVGQVSGNQILKSIDAAATRFDEWANSAKGQTALHEFFQRSKDLAAALVPVLAGVGAAIGSLALKTLPLTTALRLFGPYADEATTAFIAFKLAAIGVAVASKAASAAAVVATFATGGWTTAFWALNAALIANPIGLVVAAIAALVGGLIIAYTQSETFRAAVDATFNWIKDHWPLLLGILTGPIGLAVVAIATYWDEITGAAGAAWSWIKAAADTVWNAIRVAITTPIGIARDVLAATWDSVASAASLAWGLLTGAANVAWEAIRLAVLTPMRAARDLTAGVWESIAVNASAAWTLLAAAATLAWDGIRSVILTPLRAARELAGGVWDSIKADAETGWKAISDGVTDFANSVKDKISDAFKGAANLVIGFVNDIIDAINLIPGVPNIKPIEPLAEGGVHGATAAQQAQSLVGHARGGAFKRTGGIVNQPITLMGEEAPCIARGTLIATSMGPRPIERVKAGERVLTRNGYRAVVWSGITRRNATVVLVTTVDGDSVLCTPDHRIWTARGEWDGDGSGDSLSGGDLRGRGLLSHHEVPGQEPMRDVDPLDDRPRHGAAVPRHRGLRQRDRPLEQRAELQAGLRRGRVPAGRREADDSGLPAVAHGAAEGQGDRASGSHRDVRRGGRTTSEVLQAGASVDAGEHLRESSRHSRLQALQVGRERTVGGHEVRNRSGLPAEGPGRCSRVRTAEACGPRRAGAVERGEARVVAPHACWREAREVAVGDWVWTLGDDGELHASRVATVEAAERIDTYDLCVEIDHEFVAGGILVHNSHPEYVIPTNPAYRDRARMLLGQAAGAIGLAEGGVISAFRTAIDRTNANPKPALSLFEAGIVESGLRNLPYGDLDSTGALQVRASTAGPMGINPMDPLQVAMAFLTRGYWGKGSAISLAAHNPSQTAGWVAQQTQGSAYPDRYDQVRTQALGYLKDGGGGGGVLGAIGDAISGVTGALGDLLSKGASFILDKLPGVGSLPDWLKGVGSYAIDHVTDWIKDKVAGLVGAGGGPTSAGGPTGVGTFEGVPMASWVIESLRYGRAHGAYGNPTSGYRPGFDTHTASGRSEHQGTQYPHGAVDFGGYNTGLAEKLSYVAATSDFKWPLLAPIGFHDDGHASGTGHRMGGVYGTNTLGSFHTGTDFVPRTGPYDLQRGERVIAAAENRDGPTVRVIFDGVPEALEKCIRVEIERDGRESRNAWNAGVLS